MSNYGLLNLGSLIFGIIAWILPIINLIHRNKSDHKNWIILAVTSLSACSISLLMQIFYTNHLVKIEDWSALIDTSNAVTLVSTLLLIVTLTLNALTLVYYRKKA